MTQANLSRKIGLHRYEIAGLTAAGPTNQTILISQALSDDAAKRKELRNLLDEMDNGHFYSGCEGDRRSALSHLLASLARSGE